MARKLFALNQRNGRPQGAKDKDPGARKRRASVKREIEKLVASHPKKVRQTLKRGIFSWDPDIAFKYLQLATHMLDGKPVESIKMRVADDNPEDAQWDLTKLSRVELKAMQDALKKSKVLPEPDGTPDHD